MEHMNHNHHMHMNTTTMTMNHDHHMHHNHMNMTTMTPGSGHDHHNMNGMGNMDGMDHNNHSGMMGHMMKMYFHSGVDEYILFEKCHTQSTGAMIGACFAVFVAAILYEGLKFFRELLLQRSLKSPPRVTYGEKEMDAGISSTDGQWSNIGSRLFSSGHFIQTFLHVIQVFVSYCLMLVFMTFNVWLCLAVVLGAGFGYFLFGWKRAVIIDANEHCH